jgi:hypothetical protein
MGKLKRLYEENRLLLALGIIAIIVVGLLIVINTSSASLKGDTLKISGPYGTKITLSDIKDIALKDNLPESLNKDNGIDFFGMAYIGTFNSSDLGKIRLNVYSNHKPYIYITLNDPNYKTEIIALKDKDKTETLYNLLISTRKK